MTKRHNQLQVDFDSELRNYLKQINQFALLTPEDEYNLAVAYNKDGDVEAAHKLVTSHLRLVAKIARGYKAYGFPVMDLISEGNVGLMKAVKKYDVTKGFRLSTYAMWWIRAQIQEYILKSWSLVKIGTTTAQKKLFFSLNRVKQRLLKYDQKYLTESQIKDMSTELNVSESDIADMESRMNNSDTSLNNMVGSSDDENSAELIDMLPSKEEDQGVMIANQQEYQIRSNKLNAAMLELNERERNIVKSRKLSENPTTLDDLSKIYNISKERVRQIEARALEKLTERVSVN